MADSFPYPSERKPFGPAHRWFAVTPHDTTALARRPIYLRADTAGVLRMLNPDGDDITINVVAGEIIDARPTIVHTDTTATIHAFG